jgi:non-heme chloroperoxidase
MSGTGVSQGGTGYDMDHYADDLAALTAHLQGCHSLRRAALDGADAGQSGWASKIRVRRFAMTGDIVHDLAAGGMADVHSVLQECQLAANRSQFYFDLASGPFYGFNRPDRKPSQAIIMNWWRQGMRKRITTVSSRSRRPTSLRT